MSQSFLKIVWSPQSEEDLLEILKHFQYHTPDKANDKILEIILEVEKLIFAEQYQIDEYDPSCRRFFVKNKFRIVYKVVDDHILITRIYPTKKDPKNI